MSTILIVDGSPDDARACRNILEARGFATALHDAPAMIVVSHCKGHIQAGLGGAIKNLAMGGAAGRHRSGEWQQARGHLHAATGALKD